MKRKLEEQLLVWKHTPVRKPLILRGARQVGKTWLLKQFGENYFQNTVYLSFDREEAPKSAFENKDPARIVDLLQLLSGQPIIPGKTLLIFDEIQECPNALNALKYFCEDLPTLHVAAAGSLLGTFLAKPGAYPVGKVTLLDIAPMDFEEFLEATAPDLNQIYIKPIDELLSLLPLFHQRFLDLYHHYLLIGGMPEAVNCWIKTRSLTAVNRIQDDLITFYEGDFGKYLTGLSAARVLMVFRNVVPQLAKENEKFVYSAIKAGGRAREFEVAIEWAVSAGMLHRVYNVSKPEAPHIAFERNNCFKLFLFDTGLLCRMARVSAQQVLNPEGYQFKGPLTENYVLQQLLSQLDTPPHYYSVSDNHEIDFLLQCNGETIPIEVKGGNNVKSPSLKHYIRNHHPNIALRFSEKLPEISAPLQTLPLYLASRVHALLGQSSGGKLAP